MARLTLCVALLPTAVALAVAVAPPGMGADLTARLTHYQLCVGARIELSRQLSLSRLAAVSSGTSAHAKPRVAAPSVR